MHRVNIRSQKYSFLNLKIKIKRKRLRYSVTYLKIMPWVCSNWSMGQGRKYPLIKRRNWSLFLSIVLGGNNLNRWSHICKSIWPTQTLVISLYKCNILKIQSLHMLMSYIPKIYHVSKIEYKTQCLTQDTKSSFYKEKLQKRPRNA